VKFLSDELFNIGMNGRTTGHLFVFVFSFYNIFSRNIVTSG
jgi:hypothetical protein